MRYDEDLAIGEGSGLFTAQLAHKILFPLCALGISYMVFVKRQFRYAVIGLALFVVAGLTALSSLQRGPPFLMAVISISSIIWALLSRSNSRIKSQLLNGKTIFLATTVTLIGAGIYAFTEGESVLLGFYGLIERSLLIPSFSGTAYYGLFGDYFSFQGPGRLLGFPSVDANSLTYGDIGRAANGFSHTLNANFIATSYAALGYPGVVLMAGGVLLAARYLDGMIRNTSGMERFGLLIANIFVIFEICSGPLLNGIYSGFILNVFLYVLLFHKKFVFR